MFDEWEDEYEDGICILCGGNVEILPQDPFERLCDTCYEEINNVYADADIGGQG